MIFISTVEATVASTVGIIDSPASVGYLFLYIASNLAFRFFEFDSRLFNLSSNFRHVASYWLLMLEIQLESTTKASISAYSAYVLPYFGGESILSFCSVFTINSFSLTEIN